MKNHLLKTEVVRTYRSCKVKSGLAFPHRCGPPPGINNPITFPGKLFLFVQYSN